MAWRYRFGSRMVANINEELSPGRMNTERAAAVVRAHHLFPDAQGAIDFPTLAWCARSARDYAGSLRKMPLMMIRPTVASDTSLLPRSAVILPLRSTPNRESPAENYHRV